ncbi:MAG: hypothetical protein JGK24_22480 [Microcoleus sp. PH2017_29_MFU_D_A]|uniref:hypothetical protein n=1 Tax=unclassified Microcoleus TaxID=2642155 RepID=UPI001DFDDE8F|nr:MULTISPECIES: hypothetical protein [unclassified Microcoleus]MCC3605915.1 hypothetical protein [Microcoleus sp. PH2017_29_MFU_D_A]MCC3636974.1 hypothetical protein [Microcoleus sp. PH2017_37_MFU_D_B]
MSKYTHHWRTVFNKMRSPCPAGTVGLIFSRTGFTNAAVSLSYFSLPQAILMWNGAELKYALE